MGGSSQKRSRGAGLDRRSANGRLVHKSSVSCTRQQGEGRKRTANSTRRGARRRRGSAPLAGYIRVSTAEQGENGAGLEARLAELSRACAGRGPLLGRVYKDVTNGGSLDGRRDLRRALAAIRRGDASGIIVPRLDRLSRSVHDFSRLLRRSRCEGWELILADLGLDLATPTGELIAVILAALAEFERRLIGLNTKQGLAIKRAQGVRLGRPPALPIAVRQRIRRERVGGASWREIALRLNRDRVPTAHGGTGWYASSAQSASRSA